MSARPQITITLGRSGQVVNKSGSISDVGRTDYEPSSSSKRPIRDRLGNNVEDPHSYGRPYNDKRQRTADHRVEETKQHMPSRQVGRDDLRFKLMQKNLSKRSNADHNKRNNDLRETLSRNSHGPLRFDSLQNMPESRASGIVRQIPPAQSTEDLCHLGSLRKSYSFTSDRQRHRSPDSHLRASRAVSPPRFYDDMRHVPLLRPVGISRPTNLITNSIMDASRPEPSASKATGHVEAAKPVLRAPTGTLQKTSYMTDEPVSVASLLHSLGLGKYAILFQAEEVDMAALKQMGDNDLKEIGIPMGPRKKILLAVLPRSKQRHS